MNYKLKDEWERNERYGPVTHYSLLLQFTSVLYSLLTNLPEPSVSESEWKGRKGEVRRTEAWGPRTWFHLCSHYFLLVMVFYSLGITLCSLHLLPAERLDLSEPFANSKPPSQPFPQISRTSELRVEKGKDVNLANERLVWFLLTFPHPPLITFVLGS